MENNFDDIIESVLSKSAMWISGPYGSSKSHILNQLKEFFVDIRRLKKYRNLNKNYLI